MAESAPVLASLQPMMRPIHPAALPLTGVLLVSGCGGGGGDGGSSESAKRFDGERQKVAQVIEDFETASHDGDAKRVCDDVLAKRDRPANCERDVKAALGKGASRKIDLEVKSVRINGDKASARVAITGAGRSQATTYPLLKEGGKWRITGVAR
jgi:hypothetical protein